LTIDSIRARLAELAAIATAQSARRSKEAARAT
jgi:hypothetical protein